MALSQNLEQMMGLWGAKQTFMLGWTINPNNVYIRLLVRTNETDITLYNIVLSNTHTSLLLLAKLYVAVYVSVESTD